MCNESQGFYDSGEKLDHEVGLVELDENGVDISTYRPVWCFRLWWSKERTQPRYNSKPEKFYYRVADVPLGMSFEEYENTFGTYIYDVVLYPSYIIRQDSVSIYKSSFTVLRNHGYYIFVGENAEVDCKKAYVHLWYKLASAVADFLESNIEKITKMADEFADDAKKYLSLESLQDVIQKFEAGKELGYENQITR